MSRPLSNSPRGVAGPDELPDGVVHISEPMAVVIERLLWKFDDAIAALNVSRRTMERERSAGRFPPPDLYIGKRPMWKPETIREWIDAQSRKGVKS